MRWFSVVLLASGCINQLPDLDDPCAPWEDPGLYRYPMERPDSRNRRPYIYVPASEGPRDLVVLLHGGAMSGPKMDEATNFRKGADEFGFVLVYPNGLGWPFKDWNAGPVFEDGTDDVAFLDALVREISPRVCGRDVLGTGFSNGAAMVHRWGCEGTQVDAIAPVAGTLMVDACDGDPLPVRHYHGTDDPVVPGDGTAGTGVRGVVYTSVEDTMAAWRERNQCSDEDPVITITGDTTCTQWICQSPTEQCWIEGWGHRWPGGVNGSQTDANATLAIWEWFSAFTDDATLR